MTPRQHAVDAVNQIEEILPGQYPKGEGRLPREQAIQIVADVIEEVLQLERAEWAKEVHKAADDSWEEGERPTSFSERPVSDILKVISTNLHRLVAKMNGDEMLPAPGERLHK